ncbi:hypothetical protein KP509_15G065400 [Ceratopteris richardii]|uniref:C2H2-type domain-containing protein n=1 Tax=Ceratopteris richardii TaxID=49495 RepID=A0A8T2T6J2_CERRI|nr:hypothetical protein KP509_15G065400 [Ceratopteris richardii]
MCMRQLLPDPDVEVIALSPRSLLATNRFICEICNKGFQRDQNLQLHRRGHNLPWRLKQKASQEVKKKVYICPEQTCAHHDPARALGDLTGIKKHYSRKHGEKKWKCDKCTKRYAVLSDWKAHQKVCGTREYRCDCGTLFSRRDSFITHRAFCDALAEENGRMSTQSRQAFSHEAQEPSTNSYVPSIVGDIRPPLSATSQISRDAFCYNEASKPPLNDRIPSTIAFGFSDFRPQESNLISSHEAGVHYERGSRWGQTQIKPETITPSKTHGLSLCLGTDHGPGPPGSLEAMMAQVGTAGPALNFAGLNNVQKLPLMSSYDFIMNSSVPSIGAMERSSTLFSPRDGRPGHSSPNAMLGDATYASNCMNEYGIPTEMQSSTTMQSLSSGRLSGSIPGMMGPPSEKRVMDAYQHAGTTSSATALLQKAAQIGTTVRTPSLFQKFGTGTNVGEMLQLAEQEIGRQNVVWNGANSMYTSCTPRSRQAVDVTSNIMSGYEPTQESMNTGNEAACGSRNLKRMWTDPNAYLGQASLPVPRASGPSIAPLPLASHKQMHVPLQDGHGSLRGEQETDAAPMVDFLGVTGSSAAAMMSFFKTSYSQNASKPFS